MGVTRPDEERSDNILSEIPFFIFVKMFTCRSSFQERSFMRLGIPLLLVTRCRQYGPATSYTIPFLLVLQEFHVAINLQLAQPVFPHLVLYIVLKWLERWQRLILHPTKIENETQQIASVLIAEIQWNSGELFQRTAPSWPACCCSSIAMLPNVKAQSHTRYLA
jgi:hypothetical protein